MYLLIINLCFINFVQEGMRTVVACQAVEGELPIQFQWYRSVCIIIILVKLYNVNKARFQARQIFCKALIKSNLIFHCTVLLSNDKSPICRKGNYFNILLHLTFISLKQIPTEYFDCSEMMRYWKREILYHSNKDLTLAQYSSMNLVSDMCFKVIELRLTRYSAFLKSFYTQLRKMYENLTLSIAFNLINVYSR